MRRWYGSPGGVDATRPAEPSFRGLQVAFALAFLEKIGIVCTARNVLLGHRPATCPSASSPTLAVQGNLSTRDIVSYPGPPQTLRDDVFTPASDRWSFEILLWDIYTQGGRGRTLGCAQRCRSHCTPFKQACSHGRQRKSHSRPMNKK
jgi:hypothetical protein